MGRGYRRGPRAQASPSSTLHGCIGEGKRPPGTEEQPEGERPEKGRGKGERSHEGQGVKTTAEESGKRRQGGLRCEK